MMTDLQTHCNHDCTIKCRYNVDNNVVNGNNSSMTYIKLVYCGTLAQTYRGGHKGIPKVKVAIYWPLSRHRI